MNLYRFYCPTLAPGTIPLPEDQAHHARDVLRLASETQIKLFDGAGKHALGIIQTVAKKTVTVEVKTVETDPLTTRRHLTLATAVPKADRADWLIEQASQLGVDRVQWLDCQRGVVKPKEGGGKIDKWRRLAIESAKQCHRNTLLDIQPMRGVAEIVGNLKNHHAVFLDPRASLPLGQHLSTLPNDASILALVGPEGGWSDAELEAVKNHSAITPVRLMTNILRIETACAAVASIIGQFD